MKFRKEVCPRPKEEQLLRACSLKGRIKKDRKDIALGFIYAKEQAGQKHEILSEK
jgi:hypothetical protein